MKCERCGTDHDGSFATGRFCSVECSNSRDNKKIKVNCSVCNKTTEITHTYPKKYLDRVKCVDCRPRKRVKKKSLCPICGNICGCGVCCSKECSSKYKWKQISDKIEKSNGLDGDIRQIKKYLILERGHKCCVCRNTDWNGQPIPLVLDHINGRAKDNRLENLRLVCGNCDMQLPTYKSKNKNSQRRRK